MPSRPDRKRLSFKRRAFYAGAGALLGLGAPAGWLLWRMTEANLSWAAEELARFGSLYAYMMVGTCFAFSVFGFLLGWHDDRLAAGSEEVAAALRLAQSMAVTDALTELSNARDAHDQLSHEVEMAKRYRTPLACLMIDIDDFKKVNDVHGHPFGDTVLIAVANVIRRCVRHVDVAGRLGGEEFIVIMRHTKAAAAYPVAERIRDAVQRFTLEAAGQPIRTTVSIGVAALPGPGVRDKASLLKAADDALYAAKKAGKNRTVVQGQAAEPALAPEVHAAAQ